MGEFVFPETIKRMGQWGESGGEERKLKEREIQNGSKSAGMIKKDHVKETVFGNMSHNNFSQELSIAQVEQSFEFIYKTIILNGRSCQLRKAE